MTGKLALPAKTAVLKKCFCLAQWRLIAMLLLSVLIFHPSAEVEFDSVFERGTLHVIGVAGPTTFLPHGAEGMRGLQYELLRKFAEELNLNLKITQAANAESVIRALRSGEADIGITGLANHDPRLTAFANSQPYQELAQQLIKHHQQNTSVLEARIAVNAHSAEAQTIENLALEDNLVQMRHASPDELLLEVNTGEVDYVVMNEAEFAARRAAFPHLKSKTTLNTVQLSWTIRPENKQLLDFANHFLQSSQQDGTLTRLTAFYGQGETFNPIGVKTFQRDMQQRLPLYQQQFKSHADKYAMDWRLLAAIGYQESKWDANAISPTGVTGLMMLTKGTAKEMGIENRDNPYQSIQAGARYYQLMTEKLPDTVREPDRTWMALAAYNMGYGHVLKARKITQTRGDDPNKWLDVSRHLRQLPRSGQALVYVQEVRRYYDALLLTTTSDSWVASVDKKWVVTQ